MTYDEVLKACEIYFKKHRRYPIANREFCPQLGRKWGSVNSWLHRHKYPSLAQMFRPKPVMPSDDQILEWADAWHEKYGWWPKPESQCMPQHIAGTEYTWKQINDYLNNRKTTLHKLIKKHRGEVKQRFICYPNLTEAQIIDWAKTWTERTGKRPNRNTPGQIPGTDENWRSLDESLKKGCRNLPGGTNLFKLISPHIVQKPQLTESQILKWAQEWKTRTGSYPKLNSGKIPDTNETWQKIDACLRCGNRGLPGNQTLYSLLVTNSIIKPKPHGRARGAIIKPKLTISGIMMWARHHRQVTGKWPTNQSGKVLANPTENWQKIDNALRYGGRGLPYGNSIHRLLVKYGIRRRRSTAKRQ
jgi:hypothetical protein